MLGNKAILQGHARKQGHANYNEATHSHGREKQYQDHMRPHKAIQDHICTDSTKINHPGNNIHMY